MDDRIVASAIVYYVVSVLAACLVFNGLHHLDTEHGAAKIFGSALLWPLFLIKHVVYAIGISLYHGFKQLFKKEF